MINGLPSLSKPFLILLLSRSVDRLDDSLQLHQASDWNRISPGPIAGDCRNGTAQQRCRRLIVQMVFLHKPAKHCPARLGGKRLVERRFNAIVINSDFAQPLGHAAGHGRFWICDNGNYLFNSVMAAVRIVQNRLNFICRCHSVFPLNELKQILLSQIQCLIWYRAIFCILTG